MGDLVVRIVVGLWFENRSVHHGRIVPYELHVLASRYLPMHVSAIPLITLRGDD